MKQYIFLFCVISAVVCCGSTGQINGSQGATASTLSSDLSTGGGKKCGCLQEFSLSKNEEVYQPSSFDDYIKQSTWKSGLKCHEISDGQIECSECHSTFYVKSPVSTSPSCSANKVGIALSGGCKCPSSAPNWNESLRRCVSKKDYQPDFDKYVKGPTLKSGLKCKKSIHDEQEVSCLECHSTIYRPKKKL